MSTVFARGRRRIALGLRALGTVVQAYLDPTLRPLFPDIRDLRRRLPAQFDAQPLPDFLVWLTPTAADLSGVHPERLRGCSTPLPASTAVLPSASACAAPFFAITSSAAAVCR